MASTPPTVGPGGVCVDVPPRTSSAAVQLVFDDVSIDVHTRDKARPIKRILSGVSGTFGPNELVAVMGPSGSGKTTMLNAITGSARPAAGNISVNGKPFDRAAVKKFSALVPQDDLLTPVLTPTEALIDAAIFKGGTSKIEARERAHALLVQFGLEECHDVAIGHPEGVKGLSGGQKKRLSVALELVSPLSLLFLDEPTSGLDAVAALSLVKMLATLTKSGTTVIATIHQPSAAAFFTFDRLLLLAAGKACHCCCAATVLSLCEGRRRRRSSSSYRCHCNCTPY